jgi:poly(rC)-binding protein 2/3/4
MQLRFDILFSYHKISGDLDIAKDALIQISRRLRANAFDREGLMSAILPVFPYHPVSAEGLEGRHYDSRDDKRHGRGNTYAGGYGASDYAVGDSYGSYRSTQVFCL